MNVDGTRAVADAARACGVAAHPHLQPRGRRTGAAAGAAIAKTIRRARSTPTGAASSKASAAVRAAAGLQWTILRPGVVYGPADRALLPLFRCAARGIAAAASAERTPRTRSSTSTISCARSRRRSTPAISATPCFVGHPRSRSDAARSARGDARGRRRRAPSIVPRAAGDRASAGRGRRRRRPRSSDARCRSTAAATPRCTSKGSSAASIGCAIASASWRQIDLREGLARDGRVVSRAKGGSRAEHVTTGATRVTPSSAPTRPKMSSARVICSGVCAAEQLARSTHSSRGQPGGTIRFTYSPCAQQPLPQRDRALFVAGQDRHDRRLGFADHVAELPQSLAQPPDVRPQLIAQLRVLAHDADRGADAGDVGRRSRRREHVRARQEMQRAQLRMIRHADAADAGQRLREGADDEVDLIEDALLFGAAEARSRRRCRASAPRRPADTRRARGRRRRSRAAARRRRESNTALRRRPAGCARPAGRRSSFLRRLSGELWRKPMTCAAVWRVAS